MSPSWIARDHGLASYLPLETCTLMRLPALFFHPFPSVLNSEETTGSGQNDQFVIPRTIYSDEFFKISIFIALQPIFCFLRLNLNLPLEACTLMRLPALFLFFFFRSFPSVLNSEATGSGQNDQFVISRRGIFEHLDLHCITGFFLLSAFKFCFDIDKFYSFTVLQFYS